MKLVVLVMVFAFSGCGYALRGNTRPFFERNQIHTIYVEPVKNNSYKAGAEITIYNALRKRIALGGYVRIVDKASLADATFSAVVIDASYAPYAITTGDQITTGDMNRPTHPELGNVQVAKSYNVNLRVHFRLKVNHPEHLVYDDEIQRNKTFPATVFLNPLGSTSALISESDFERALDDLSASIVTDAEESVNTFL